MTEKESIVEEAVEVEQQLVQEVVEEIREDTQQLKAESIRSFFKPRKNGKLLQLKVFELLSDEEWHCRACEGAKLFLLNTRVAAESAD